MTEKGFGLSLMDQIQNEGTVHQELIRRIEGITKRNLICYTAFFRHPASAIIPEDSELIEHLLRSVDMSQYPGTIDLLVYSPGGDPTAAERVILTCRSYASSFRVIVVRAAMSAATLLAMGADSILMTDTSELGPIDPQMLIRSGQDVTLRPAASFVTAYTDLINKIQEAIANKQSPLAYVELLRKMDPSWIQECIRARELARTIAVEFLKKYMLAGQSAEEISKTVEHFIKEGETLSHGRVVRCSKALEYGLKVETVEKASELDKLLWELHIRCENYVQLRGFAKYFLYRSGGLNVAIQRMVA